MFMKRDMVKEYLRFILPTMLTFVIASIYSIVDGIFVGQAVGDSGLAGINVAYPVIALITAIGTGIGMGGGVVASLASGSGDSKRAGRANGTALTLLAIVSIPLAIILVLCAEPLCALLGGRGETLTQATLYLSFLAWAAPFQIFTIGCTPLIRNRGNVNYAMTVQLSAGGLNIALDYVFVMLMGMGTPGAALATAFSQIVSFVLVGIYYLRPANRIPFAYLRMDGQSARHIMRIAIAPFGLTLLPSTINVIINVNASATGGEVALAAWAAINYMAYVVFVLIQGVGDGSQPLISKYHGAGKDEVVRRIRNSNYLIAMLLGAAGLGAMYLLRWQIPLLFGASAEAASLIAWALPIYSLCFVLYGFTHTVTPYLYAVDRSRRSSFIVIGEAGLSVLLVSAGAALFGLDGIWFSATAVQVVLCATVLFAVSAPGRKLHDRTARSLWKSTRGIKRLA